MKLVACKVTEEIYDELLKRGSITDVLREALSRYLSNVTNEETTFGWTVLAHIYDMKNGKVEQLKVNLPNERGEDIFFSRKLETKVETNHQESTKGWEPIKVDLGASKVKSQSGKNKRSKTKTTFENNIIKEVRKLGYTTLWDENIIHDISIKLNNCYQTVLSSQKIKEIFGKIFLSHGYSFNNGMHYAYVTYFKVSGQLKQQKQKSSSNQYFYDVIKNNIIPRKKEENDLGILNELNMS